MFDQPDHTWLEASFLALNAWIGLLTPAAGVVGVVWAVWKALKELRQAREQRDDQIKQAKADAAQRDTEDRWRRAKFVSELMEKLFAKPKVRTAMLLLDYNSIGLDECGQFAPDRSKANYRIDDAIIVRGIADHNTLSESDSFDSQEMLCREAFDAFFHELQTLNAHVTNKLISVDDLTPYLDYWIRLLACPQLGRKPPEFYTAVARFAHVYGYEGAVKLCRGFTSPAGVPCDLSPDVIAGRLRTSQNSTLPAQRSASS